MAQLCEYPSHVPLASAADEKVPCNVVVTFVIGRDTGALNAPPEIAMGGVAGKVAVHVNVTKFMRSRAVRLSTCPA
jgi:hypothetical protein